MKLPRLTPLSVSLVVAISLLPFTPAQAETKEIRAAQQYGLSYLNLMIMQDQHLIEKQARTRGLGNIKVTWAKLGGPGAMNDALLSGGLDFASGGVPSLVTLWNKTKGSPMWVKSVGALNSMPCVLVTSDAKVKSIKDFGPGDKIAVPTVKVSTQALLLQMAAAKTWGQKNYTKLDSLTVTLPHPDAAAALINHSGAITAHYSSPPFTSQELATPGLHGVLTSYQTLGGKSTFNVVWTTSKFVKDNPKTYAAFVAAFEEATNWINKHPKDAAATYIKLTHTKLTLQQLTKIITDPQTTYTLAPQNIMKTAVFMHKIGRVKSEPASWKDLFFPNVYKYKGS